MLTTQLKRVVQQYMVVSQGIHNVETTIQAHPDIIDSTERTRQLSRRFETRVRLTMQGGMFMSIESKPEVAAKPQTPEVGAVTAPNPANLSEQMFGNPKEFLSILKQDFYHIPTAVSGEMTKDDLAKYLQTPGGDAKDKAAAQIALTNFDEIRSLSAIPSKAGTPGYGNVHYLNDRQIDALTTGDLQIAMDMNDGKTLGYKIGHEAASISMAATDALMTVGLGFATAMVAPIPPTWWLTALAGIGTVEVGALTYLQARSAFRMPSQIDAVSRQDQKLLSSWDAFNKNT